MAISFIDQGVSDLTSITIPATTAVGDLIIIFAWHNGASPSTPAAGWTTITSIGGNSNSLIAAYRFATGGDTSGTWNLANNMAVLVYRGASGIGRSSTANHASSTTTTFPALTLQSPSGSAWVVGAGGCATTTSMTTPSGGTLRSSNSGTGFLITVDTNGGANSWTSATSTQGAAAVGSGLMFEVLAPQPITFSNYQFADVGSGMSTSEKIA